MLGSSIKTNDIPMSKELNRLRKLVEELKREINSLKSRVTTLES